jgi:hypothetical protein
MDALALGTMSLMTGTENAVLDIESATTGTKNAALDPEIVGMPSMSASTCAAIGTFSERFGVAKQSLASPTIRDLVAVREGGLAADQWQYGSGCAVQERYSTLNTTLLPQV